LAQDWHLGESTRIPGRDGADDGKGDVEKPELKGND